MCYELLTDSHLTKHVLRAYNEPGENRGERLGEFESRSPAREFSQILPRFSTEYEGTDNIFNFFYKISIFRLNKEKDDIRSAYIYFSFFNETVNSHNFEIEPTTLLTSFSCFIAL